MTSSPSLAGPPMHAIEEGRSGGDEAPRTVEERRTPAVKKLRRHRSRGQRGSSSGGAGEDQAPTKIKLRRVHRRRLRRPRKTPVVAEEDSEATEEAERDDLLLLGQDGSGKVAGREFILGRDRSGKVAGWVACCMQKSSEALDMETREGKSVAKKGGFGRRGVAGEDTGQLLYPCTLPANVHGSSSTPLRRRR